MLAKPRWSRRPGWRACGDARRDLAWKSETCRLSKSRRYKQESFSPSRRIVPIRTPRHSLRAHASRRRRRDGHRLRAPRVSPVREPRVARRCVGRAGDARSASRGTPRPVRWRDMSSRSTPSPGTPAFAAAASRGRGPPGSRPRSSPPRRRPRWRSPRRRRSRKRARRRRTRGAIHRKSAQLRGRPLVRIRATRHSSPAGSTRLPRSTRRTTPTVPCGALSARAIPRRTCASQRDRKRQNDSPCKVPLLNACLVWKEGASKDVVLKR